MLDASLGQAPAHGEAGMASANDDDIRGGHGARLDGVGALSVPRGYFTSTVTLVGLVMMSYTAERFCDCATSASMSSLEASASML